MQLAEFIIVFQDLLQRDEPVAGTNMLADIEEWDSLAIMALIAWFDKNFSLRLTFPDFKALRTVADVAALAGIKA